MDDDCVEIRISDAGIVTDEELNEDRVYKENAEEQDSQSETEENPRAIAIPRSNTGIDVSSSYIPPNQEMIEKIVTQVEFYFSDANLPNDKFLIQRIKRDKKGFVSVRLINGFNKMKKLGVTDEDITYALRTQSTQLQLNSSGKKLKRISPLVLTSIVESQESVDPLKRMVLAINLEEFNEALIRKVFEKCGKVEEVQLLTTDSKIPATILPHTKKHFKILPPNEWALIRYDSRDNAEKACRKLTNTEDWRRGLRVSLLIAGGKKNDKNAKPDHHHHDDSSKSRCRVAQLSRDESASNSTGSDMDSSSGEGIKILNRKPGRKSGSKLGRSPLTDDMEDPRMRSSSFDTDRPILASSPVNNSASSSPWVQRRLRSTGHPATTGSSPSILSCSPLKSNQFLDAHKKSENVIRDPKGPDGGKGFELLRMIANKKE